jgi:hypothetical protein
VLDVDLQDVKNYDDVLGQLLEENPNTYIPLVRTLLFPAICWPSVLMHML